MGWDVMVVTNSHVDSRDGITCSGLHSDVIVTVMLSVTTNRSLFNKNID